ncbi:hypothetical protein HU200_011144 [Digitaria exilis]|uniref:Uncharacterized protein n=1 Tax=Digitaria exilis TaxID=1010633 RepID=A0A835KMZ1_9POAL|nr:hypothetical protein HU200_011144 [Digitaria exilis]
MSLQKKETRASRGRYWMMDPHQVAQNPRPVAHKAPQGGPKAIYYLQEESRSHVVFCR